MVEPISTGAKIALTVATAATSAVQYQRQRRQQAALAEQLRDQRAQTLRPHPAGADIPIAYGRTVVQGLLAYPGSVGSRITLSGERIGSLTTTGRAKNEYLLVQHVLCAADIDAVTDVWLEDQSIASGDFVGHVTSAWRNGGAAEPMATGFTADRAATDIFEGLAYLTTAARHDRDNPRVHGVPQPLVFLRGRKVRTVFQKNAKGEITGLGSSRTFSPNAIAVLLDYLTSDDFGPGLPPTDLDLPSWSHAMGIAGQIVQGDSSVLWGQAYPAALNAELGTSYAGWTDYMRDLNFQGEGESGWIEGGPAAPKGDVPAHVYRHEINGVLPSSRDFPDVIDQILATIPDAVLFRSVAGTWKIRLGDSMRSAQGQSVATIGDRHLVEPVRIGTDATTRLNQVTIRYADGNRRFAESSLTWPADGGALLKKFRDADGGVRLHRQLDLAGVATSYHAASIAATSVLLSRRPSISFRAVLGAALLEPGDVVRVVDSAQGIDRWVRLLSVALREDLTVDCDGVEFAPSDYAWVSDELAVLNNLASVDETVGAPKSVTVSVQSGNRATVQWVPADAESARVTSYEIEVSSDSGATWAGAAIVGRTAREWSSVPTLAAATLQYRVRAVENRGRVSPWTVGSSVSLSALTGIDAAGVEFIFRRTATDAAPATPTTTTAQDAEDQYVPTDWTADPQGVRAIEPYEWISVRRKGKGETSWSKFSTPALWSRWGRDGKGAEFVYRATADIVAPATPTTTAEQDAEDDYVPTGWADDPITPTRDLPFVWTSVRRGFSGAWGKFVKPALWANLAGSGPQVTWSDRAPLGISGRAGDTWVQRGEDGEIYSVWGKRGAEWIERIQHPDLAAWSTGRGSPGASSGSVGDYFGDQATGNVWLKLTDDYWHWAIDLDPSGELTWLFGAGSPTGAVGKVGDQYYRWIDGHWFERLETVGWSYVADLTGGSPDRLTAPGQAGTPTLSSRTDTELSLMTTRPATGGAPSRYRWQYSLDSALSIADPTVISDSESVTITGLTEDTAYWIRVRAENAAGSAAYSGVLATRTLETPSGPVVSARNPPSSVSHGSVDHDSATISWGAPAATSATLIGFEVKIWPSGGREPSSYFRVSSSTRSWDAADLDASTLYRYAVRAVYSSGVSGDATGFLRTSSAPSEPTVTAPGRPSAPTLSSRTHGSLSVSGSAPSSTGGAPILRYDWQWSTSSSFSGAANRSTSSPSTILTGLEDDTRYHVRYRAENRVGEGAWSPTAVFQTLAAPEARYNPPTSIVITRRLQTTVTIEWTPPDNSNPATRSQNSDGVPARLIGYAGAIWASGSSEPGADASLTATSFVASSLAAGTTYSYRIAARYNAGRDGTQLSDYVRGTFTTRS